MDEKFTKLEPAQESRLRHPMLEVRFGGREILEKLLSLNMGEEAGMAREHPIQFCTCSSF
jgi:hypothetical protein